jgi:hypothetical protein
MILIGRTPLIEVVLPTNAVERENLPSSIASYREIIL